MPESPEVVITIQYLKKIINNEIILIKILSGRYTHQGIKGLELLCYPLIIKKINSKGKFIWFELINKNNKKIYLLNTLGLTGLWNFEKKNNSRIEFIMKEKKYNLYYIDQLNFGTINFTDNYCDLENKKNTLAPDILKSNLNPKKIFTIFNNLNKKYNNKNIVHILMDQKILVSGIGNYLTSEILYNANINPNKKLIEFNNKEIKKLSFSICKILKLAYYNNTIGYMENFGEFSSSHYKNVDLGIFPNYFPKISVNSFEFKVYKKKYDSLGNDIKREQIIKNRFTYWVPIIQK